MAASKDIVFVPDGTFDFTGGVDSNKVKTLKSELNPNGLERNQLAWLINGTCRNGPISQRGGWQPLTTIIPSGTPFLYQGGYIYEPDGAYPYLVCQISGVLYSVLLQAPYTVTDLTAGNPALQNPATAEMAFFVQAENFLVIQAGDYFTSPPLYPAGTLNDYGQPLATDSNTLPLFWDGTTLRRSRGITTPVPTQTNGLNELPAATCMGYYGNRIWYAQSRQFAAGDMVGGPSGTAGNFYRDAVLNVTENPLCFGGDGFTVPTNAGNIRAIKSSASINASLGQGQLYIFTRKSVYSMTVPPTRTDWINADAQNQPEQKVVQIGNGAVGDRCVVAVNSDLFYMSFDPAVRSLITAVRYFGQWGNTPISQNEDRLLKANDRSLMRFSGAIEFDNRILFCVLPRLAADGVNVVHDGLMPLDFEIVSNLEGTSNPVWEGALSGLQILQPFEADFGGISRGFVTMISSEDGSLGVWELTRDGKTENGDNRITTSAESPAYTWSAAGMETKLKRIVGGEIWIDKLAGTAEIDVWYRQDADPCWWRWYHKSMCTARDCFEADPPIECYPNEDFCTGYASALVLPEPKGVCGSMGVRPSNIGYQFQVKIVFKGSMRILGFIPYAIFHPEPPYRGLECQTGLQSGMVKLPNPFA